MNNSDRIFLDSFYINFATFRNEGTPIALYGVGEKTKLLLENIQGFNIVGLMDKDSAGKIIYGQPVLCYEEVIEKVKAIIIVANMSIAPLIYQRINLLSTQQGIEILYINGTKSPVVNEPVKNKPSSETTIENLEKIIDKNEIISFDLFDTLIMRKVLHPTDIFDLVERELREKHQISVDFKSKRIEAEHHCYRQKDKYCTIHNIYERLQEVLHCSKDLILKIQQMEIETELKYCAPREAMLRCFEYAKKQLKVVLITTDSFLTRDYIVLLLDKCGIRGYNHLLISCEERKLKYLGDMWEHVSQSFKGNRILHIGDNQITDIEMAQKEKVNAFKIESAYDLLSTSSLRHLCKSAKTIDDSVLLGQLAVKFFHNPFILNKNGGFLPIEDPYSLGYLSFAPLVLNFLLWLIRKSTEYKMDKLLFFARDGYILAKLYRRLCDFYKVDRAEAIYFLTSRRAASVAAIKSEDDIVFVINHVCKIKKVKFHQLLSTAFGVLPIPGDLLCQKLCYEIAVDELTEHILHYYKDMILKNAMIERQNYIDYINTLGLKDTDTLGCVNFVGRGLTQRSIANILEKELSGFYFAKELDMLDIFTPLDKCHALYKEYISPHVSKSHLATKFIFGEVVFSSPDEQLVRFEKTGRPVFEKRGVMRDFKRIERCHTGIERSIEDIMILDNQLLLRNFDHEIVDMLYGLFSSSSSVCSEEVRQSFFFNDYYNPDMPNLMLNIS